MDNDAKRLIDRSNRLYVAAGDAIDWVDDVKVTSQRLERGANGLVLKLRKARNLFKRLERAASRPMSVGFIGASQAGKSWVISALAAGQNGLLETVLDGRRLDFVKHVDPGGKEGEATGLVTRFTRTPVEAPEGYPLKLTLFSEIDLVKILGNSFFKDVNVSSVGYDNDPENIRSSILSPLQERKRESHLVSGITEDDVVDLREYFRTRFKSEMEPLLGDYWPSAIELAPYLVPEDRARLFSVLWGGVEELTQAYLMLRGALEKLGHAEVCYCAIDSLVSEDASGELSKDDGIVRVDVLKRLGADGADQIGVVPVMSNGKPAEAIYVPRSILSALTAELHFVLAESPSEEVFEDVDLLDFPGYRGRGVVHNASEFSGSVIPELILRGKVAYLFERYTDDQEMNVLVLCTKMGANIDAADLSVVMDSWVAATQGATPLERAFRSPGLVWAVTRSDQYVSALLPEPKPNVRTSWNKMMDVILEKFNRCEWLQDWSEGQPFRNFFLTRKPGLVGLVNWIEFGAGATEAGIVDQWQPQIDMLKETFVENSSVQRYFADPSSAWDSMTTMNDGGISSLAEYLSRVAKIEVKVERIKQHLDAESSNIVNTVFGDIFQQEGSAELAQKQAIVEAVVADLGTPKKAVRFGEMLRAMQPSVERLRARYLRTEGALNSKSDSAESTAAHDLPEDDESLFSLDDLGPNVPSKAVTFAKVAMSDWFDQLRSLGDDFRLMQFLAADPKILQNVADELIIGAGRLDVEGCIVENTQEAEAREGATGGSLVARQVMTAATCINEFVDYLGVNEITLDARPVSSRMKDRALFEPPKDIPIIEREDGRKRVELPVLPPTQTRFSAWFVQDWLDAFAHLAIKNVGHSTGREIEPEQNERLGQILKRIETESDLDSAT